MRYIRLITYISIMLLAVTASASPARRGPVVLTQPDGTAFTALLQGDEFARIKTTLDGHAILQNEDGWWCYAIYSDDGSRYNSNWRIGSNVPESILNKSLYIPRGEISRNAVAKRQSAYAVSSLPDFEKSLAPTKAMTQMRGIVILAQFKDIKFANKKEDFNSMLNSSRYNRYGATGSAREYFESQFNHAIGFTFDVSDIVTLPAKREYYGENDNKGNDMRPEHMVADACTIASQNGVDFSKYDSNKDGKVDNIFVFFAGEDEAEGADESSIWSHSWYLFSGAGVSLELNGKLIDRYACASEMTRILDTVTGRLVETRFAGIGTFCHEYSHTFGLPDLYDTDYDNEGGWAAGLWGSTALMDSGNQNNHGNTPPNYNAIEREILGISDPVIIETDGKYTISPIQGSGQTYRLNTDRTNEYYLFECRSDTDNAWDRHIGGSGMLVYHIDKSRAMIDRWEIENTVNANSRHQCADLVEADGRSDSHPDYMDYLTRRENLTGLFFPYNKTDNIFPSGVPGLNYWSGATGNISITGIQRNENGSISFNVIGFTKDSTPPSVKGEIKYETFPDGVILNFEADRPHTGDAYISYSANGEDITELKVSPYKEGKYALMLERLNPVKTYTVSIYFTMNDIKGATKELSFMTKKQPVTEWPYISFGTVKRNSNGTFVKGSRIPLKVNNSRNIKEISWSFDGVDIKPEGDMYYTLNKSGILRAYIYMEDGTEIILVKEITTSAMTIQ